MDNTSQKDNKNKKKSKASDIAFMGIYIALAFIFGYIESLMPFNFGIPGVKAGLANIVIVIILYLSGFKRALFLNVVRVVLTAFTFGNMASMIYSVSGAILSICVMYMLKKTGKFSIMGISAAGGVSHNAGQLIVAALMLGKAVFYYLPVLIVTGCITGAVIGITGGIVYKYVIKYVNAGHK